MLMAGDTHRDFHSQCQRRDTCRLINFRPMAAKQELIGVRAQGGPLERTVLRLDERVTVLYGLNGAGKSRLLDAIRQGLSGLAPDTGQRLDGGFLFIKASGGSPLNRAVQRVLMGMDAYELLTDEEAEPVVEAKEREHIAEALRSRFPRWGTDDEERALVEETTGQRLFAVRAVGRTEPRWEVWACGWPTSDAPLLYQAHQDLVQAVARLRLTDELGEDDDPQGTLGEQAQRAVEGHRLNAWQYADGGYELRFEFDTQGAGLPVIVGKICEISEPVFDVLDDARQVDVDDLSQFVAALQLPQAHRLPRVRGGQPGDRFELTDELYAWTQDLQDKVNVVYRQLLRDAPTLELIWSPPASWLAGIAPLRWTSRGKRSGPDGAGAIPVAELSRAERRWAEVAIEWVLRQATGTKPLVVLLDEPEAALHRTAEEHLAQGLASSSDRCDYMILATHSPFLLDHDRMSPVRVHSVAGVTHADRLERLDLESLTELGLHPSDLLRRPRVILLVEGRHDEIILKELLGEEFHRLRVETLPVYAGRNMPHALEGRVLFDFTEAHIVALVDNLKADTVSTAWAEALALRDSDGPEAAGDLLRQRLSASQASENKFLAGFLSRAIDRGREARVSPFALSLPDIPWYLPVDSFVPDARSWAELDARRRKAAPDTALKAWLEQTHPTCKFDDETLRAACSRLDHIPEDFTSLLEHCRQVAEVDNFD